jgi:hypothetical protein
MTPTPPKSSGGAPLPQRHRPNLGDLVKDSIESDLWAFDDIASVDEVAKKAAPKAPSIPAIRDTGRKKAHESTDLSEAKNAGSGEPIRINVSRKLPKVQMAGPLTGQPAFGADFDDLDRWDKPEEASELGEISAEIAVTPLATRAAREPIAEPSPPPVARAVSPPADDLDEFSPRIRENATPVSLRPHLALSLLERLGLGLLLLLLLMGAGVIFFNTIHRLPTNDARLKANHFPITGQHLSIQSANSYWRAPIAEGENAETFRRETQLLPVVNLISSGGPAAVRVFFRNSDGDLIGDAVTRLLKAGTPLQVAATAGFDDIGMHAAYRTGQSKPWIVQVYEAPSENSAVSDFKQLFEMNISTDRR